MLWNVSEFCVLFILGGWFFVGIIGSCLVAGEGVGLLVVGSGGLFVDGDNVVEGVKILEIYNGTPASKSKLVIGDIIQTVNGKTLTSKEFVSKNYGIKGPRNTIVSLGIKGKGKYNIRRGFKFAN